VIGGGLDKAIGIAGALVVLLALLVIAIMIGTGIAFAPLQRHGHVPSRLRFVARPVVVES